MANRLFNKYRLVLKVFPKQINEITVYEDDLKNFRPKTQIR